MSFQGPSWGHQSYDYPIHGTFAAPVDFGGSAATFSPTHAASGAMYAPTMAMAAMAMPPTVSFAGRKGGGMTAGQGFRPSAEQEPTIGRDSVVKVDHIEFARNFRCIAPKKSANERDPKKTCADVCGLWAMVLGFAKTDWRVEHAGMGMVVLHPELWKGLTRQRQRKLLRVLVALQRRWRKRRARLQRGPSPPAAASSRTCACPTGKCRSAPGGGIHPLRRPQVPLR
eukprot:TRINITY_DN11242_c0_g1_i1.p2 TRINITY_DN11242_c0_g1~~TRINITY_DN11242_c0_g1_i1.p2  ORF type:complete len:243 (+),score=42.30 TRINITY_DN11242_c0_g1_i1:50-730(+)